MQTFDSIRVQSEAKEHFLMTNTPAVLLTKVCFCSAHIFKLNMNLKAGSEFKNSL